MSSADDDDQLVCDHCGEDADSLLSGEHILTCSDISEYGDRLHDAALTMDGEADELAMRRPHPDGQLYDIEEGLRFRSQEIQQWLEEEYFV